MTGHTSWSTRTPVKMQDGIWRVPIDAKTLLADVYGLSQGEASDRAKFIVRACNEYDANKELISDLVAALESLLFAAVSNGNFTDMRTAQKLVDNVYAEWPEDTPQFIDQRWEQARQALAKARGEI